MAILRKTSTRKEDYKLIGVSVRRWVHEYLTLYTLAKDCTKSILLRDMVEKLIIEKREAETDAILITEVSNRLNTIRYNEKIEGKALPIEKYKLEVEKELKTRGLKQTYIEIILSEILP